jgi:hypothetical protein
MASPTRGDWAHSNSAKKFRGSPASRHYHVGQSSPLIHQQHLLQTPKPQHGLDFFDPPKNHFETRNNSLMNAGMQVFNNQPFPSQPEIHQ